MEFQGVRIGEDVSFIAFNKGISKGCSSTLR